MTRIGGSGITQRLRDAGGVIPDDGVKVYLTDTLEPPDTLIGGQIPLALRRLGVEHERARAVKTSTTVLVCMGNPPYDRQAFDAQAAGDETRRERRDRLLGPFLELARGQTIFSHLASLYNLYVYFWRWGLWKVFETGPGPGIISFITASSYLRSPGFVGMREIFRRTFDDLWIIDLGGDNRGTRRTENVFAIETPVAIAIGVRYGPPNPDEPAVVRYREVTGSRDDKLAILDGLWTFADLSPWTAAPSGWGDPFVPVSTSDFRSWPDIRDLFPWQSPGVKVGRTWPIGTSPDVLQRRWETFAEAPAVAKADLLPNRRFGRTTSTRVGPTVPPAPEAETLSRVGLTSPRAEVVLYGYRSMVRHHLLADPRLIDLQRPSLWRAHSPAQLYLTSLLTQPLGHGPAVSVTARIPDLHFYRGSFGGKDIIPLWRDAEARVPNLAPRLLEALAPMLGSAPEPLELLAYTTAILGSQRYADKFEDELRTESPHVPLTADPDLFREGVRLGLRIIHAETFGEYPVRGLPDGVPAGRARARVQIPATAGAYPQDYEWIPAPETLRVGSGTFAPVLRQSWEFEFSGMRPLRTWLGYRMREPAGRTSSDLDRIGADTWTPAMTDELLDLLWALEQLVDLQPQLTALVDAVSAAPKVDFDSVLPDDDPLRAAPMVDTSSQAPMWEF